MLSAETEGVQGPMGSTGGGPALEEMGTWGPFCLKEEGCANRRQRHCDMSYLGTTPFTKAGTCQVQRTE